MFNRSWNDSLCDWDCVARFTKIRFPTLWHFSPPFIHSCTNKCCIKNNIIVEYSQLIEERTIRIKNINIIIKDAFGREIKASIEQIEEYGLRMRLGLEPQEQDGK